MENEDWQDQETIENLESIPGWEEIADAPLLCPRCGQTFGSFRLLAKINPRNEPPFFCNCPRCQASLTYKEVRENMVRVIVMWGAFQLTFGVNEAPDKLTLKEFIVEITKLPRHTAEKKGEKEKPDLGGFVYYLQGEEENNSPEMEEK